MATLLDPAILFFVLGIVAGAARSNLEIPQQVARFLSLYLLMALGLKGGFSLAASGFTPEVFKSLLAALALAVVVPLASYALLRRLLPPFDAAALCLPALQAAARAIAPQGWIYLEASRRWDEAGLAPLGLACQRYLKAGAAHAHLLQRLPVHS